MPRLNGMGPMGIGPMTGKGMGLCRKTTPSKLSGMGLGTGRAFRRGAGRCFYNGGYGNQEDDKTFLERQKTILEENLDNIKTRLSELNEEK
ncbi:DUF5320 domain-containing protein [Brassicibacter mesophilus]|uniref:DUF5320 domain-containing protein n=1 Tax=Brassicibacter mesophilus TaxID=745119 RepID=UPI003D237973